VNLSHRQLTEAIAELLLEWLPHQRWFGGKQRAITAVRPVRGRTLHDPGEDGPRLEHLVVAVTTDNGHGPEEQLYQLLIGVRRHLPERLEHALIGALAGGPGAPMAYDATHDSDLNAVLLRLIAENATVDGVRFSTEPGVTISADMHSRPIIAEQSNTSVVYGDSYILKLFRKLQLGVSADLELHRALQSVSCQHIAEPFGAIEGEFDSSPVSYGILQRFFANCADGWAMAITSVRDLIAEADLHADEVGGDFAAESERLGQAVAAVHADLAKALGTEIVPADRAHTVAAQMNARLDDMVRRVDRLEPYAGAIRAAFDEVAKLGEPVAIQRIHGDLHLGQALRTVSHWVLIDFEGEPSRPLAERIAMMTPLRDVAGMLRSFDYAAHHLLVDHNPIDTTASEAQLEYRAMEWAARNREAFCDGYATGGTDPREHAVLMRALELEKAVYEVGYEFDNRPSWVDIPLRSIARLVG
jgi:maltokinase